MYDSTDLFYLDNPDAPLAPSHHYGHANRDHSAMAAAFHILIVMAVIYLIVELCSTTTRFLQRRVSEYRLARAEGRTAWEALTRSHVKAPEKPAKLDHAPARRSAVRNER